MDCQLDLAGHQIAEISSSGAWNRGEIYAGSRHLGTYNNGATFFNHEDWLGTERARSNVTGVVCETITSLPYGDGQNTAGTCGDESPMHFTGKMRDTESNLDDFDARYYSSQWGRFMIPDWDAKPVDVPYAKFGDPQSLNLYGYVRNNPSTTLDTDGHDWGIFWTDIKTAAHQLYYRPAAGVGLDAKMKVGNVSAQIGADAKLSFETSPGAKLKISADTDAGASATAGPVSVGESMSTSTTLATVNNDNTVTGPEKTEVTITDSLGGHTTQATNSDDRHGISFETGGPETDFIHVGGEVGLTNKGVAAIKDAGKQLVQSLKDSLTTPPPPPPPKPPTPPVLPQQQQ